MSLRSSPPPESNPGQGTAPPLPVVHDITTWAPRDPFLNTEDACCYLGVPKATLLTWRVRRPGYGPRAVKAGGRLKYRLSELDRWLSDHEETFAFDEDLEDPGPGSSAEAPVRTRNRASRVSGGARRAAHP